MADQTDVMLDVLRDMVDDLQAGAASSQRTAAEVDDTAGIYRNGLGGLRDVAGVDAEARRLVRSVRDLQADYERVARSLRTLARTQVQTRTAVIEYLQRREP